MLVFMILYNTNAVTLVITSAENSKFIIIIPIILGKKLDLNLRGEGEGGPERWF